MQITNRAKQKSQDALVDELGVLAREMVEAEGWDTEKEEDQ